jgi:uracil-DNA glycosylase
VSDGPRVGLGISMVCSWSAYRFPHHAWPELGEELKCHYMKRLCRFLEFEQADWVVYPKNRRNVFRAFRETALDNVRIVILGQDPYHDPRAVGLAFSVEQGAVPRSLNNIRRALELNLCGAIAPSDLSCWARQGVLLLNTALTVGEIAGSHRGRGWERFTDRAIELLSEKRDGLVFLLWGKHAHKKAQRIDRAKHEVLCAVHPRLAEFASSCDHFARADKHLGSKAIQWSC